MGRFVIACYRPKAGKREALHVLMKTHLQRLRAEGLVTDRKSAMMEAQDGTVIEVFEWKSKEAIEAAHSNPQVMAMWSEYEKVCDYVPVSSLKETKELFAEFEPLNLTES
ncbi:MAG: hypothetical protein O7H41_14775 [Planctomycetota bacterium]|nr:hypothetical protein [Planctomycetota bacterium]